MTVKIWERDVEEYVKKWNTVQENLKTAFSLVYGQCSEELRAKLESRPDHAEVEATSDSLRLLRNIRTVMFQFQSQRYAPLALHEAKRRFYVFTQEKAMTCQQYYETFRNNADVIEYCGRVLGNDPGIVDNELMLLGMDREAADAVQIALATASA